MYSRNVNEKITMKLNKLTGALLIAGACAMAQANASDDRYIIQVDNSKKVL